MGLDMYLKANVYIGGWSHSSEDEKARYSIVTQAIGLPEDWTCEGSPHLDVSVNVAYWRKANHIHNWFVQNVQEGSDDCREYTVDREKLMELIETCKTVLKDPERAKELLPTQSGFFFGDTEYGDYYFSDIRDTIDQLESILRTEALKGASFSYQSSW